MKRIEPLPHSPELDAPKVTLPPIIAPTYDSPVFVIPPMYNSEAETTNEPNEPNELLFDKPSKHRLRLTALVAGVLLAGAMTAFITFRSNASESPRMVNAKGFSYKIDVDNKAKFSELNGTSVIAGHDIESGYPYTLSINKSTQALMPCSNYQKESYVSSLAKSDGSFNVCKKDRGYFYYFTHNNVGYSVSVISSSSDSEKLLSSTAAKNIIESLQITLPALREKNIAEEPKIERKSNASPKTENERSAIQTDAGMQAPKLVFDNYMMKKGYHSLDGDPLDNQSLSFNTHGYQNRIVEVLSGNAKGTITHPDGTITTVFIHKMNDLGQYNSWEMIWDGRPLASKEIGNKYGLPAQWVSTNY